MAMLAAPRRKQKFSVDPRGSSWSKDDSKFGQKLLEKMGWSKGRGLGANEDGRVEHVKISLKDDTRGVGCSKSQADNWIAHQEDFNSLLANLNQNYANEEDKPTEQMERVQSLEEKSKSSKGRVHYQKFTKGKDLSSRKLEDLDCIFGRRRKKKSSKKDKTVDGDEVCFKSSVNEDNQDGGQTFTSSDSVQGYFARKLAEKDSAELMDMENSDEQIEESSAIVKPKDSASDTDQSDFGIKTYKSSQNVQDYFAHKMALLKSGKNSSVTQQNCSDKMEIESVSFSPSECSLSAGTEEQGEHPKKKKQKKRKHERCEVQTSEKKNQACTESEETGFEKKKRKLHATDKNVEDKPSLLLDGPTEAADTKKRKKDKKRKRKVETDALVTESSIKLSKVTELCPSNLKNSHADTPSRKKVHFMDPIRSVLGENTNTNSEECEIKPSGTDFPADAESSVDVKKEQCVSVEGVCSKKKKKSKKKNKKKRLEESVNESSCRLNTEGDEIQDSVSATDPGDITPLKKKKQKKKVKSETEPKNRDSAQILTDADSQIRELVDKKKEDLVLRKTSVNVKPNFVGSNIDEIPGYSSANLLLLAR